MHSSTLHHAEIAKQIHQVLIRRRIGQLKGMRGAHVSGAREMPTLPTRTWREIASSLPPPPEYRGGERLRRRSRERERDRPPRPPPPPPPLLPCGTIPGNIPGIMGGKPGNGA